MPEELALPAEAREVVNGLTLTLTRPYPNPNPNQTLSRVDSDLPPEAREVEPPVEDDPHHEERKEHEHAVHPVENALLG